MAFVTARQANRYLSQKREFRSSPSAPLGTHEKVPTLTRLIRIAIWGLLLGVTLGWVMWGTVAWIYYPAVPGGLALVFGLLWLLIWAPAVKAAFRTHAWRACALTASVALAFAWGWLEPSHDREWVPDQARLPWAEWREDDFEIHNVRNARYRSTDDFDLEWVTRTHSLADCSSVDYIVEPFAGWRGPAHTFLSFGFDDGRRLCISAEIRREIGEEFAPLPGIFRNYEVMYVVGDELDVLALRVNHRKNPVNIYPTRATREQAQQLLRAMLERVNLLREAPEYYNTILNNCTTSIVRPVSELMSRTIPRGYRTILPGYSDGIALEMGWLDHDGSLESLRQRFRVHPLPEVEDSSAWSAALRAKRGMNHSPK